MQRLLFVLILGSVSAMFAAAQDAGPKPDDRRLARYEAVLLANPRPGTAFDKLYGLYEAADRLAEWTARLAHEADEAQTDARYPLLLGYVYEKRGEIEAALAGFDRSLARDPAFLPARLARGFALERLGRLEEAAEELERAAGSKPPRDVLESLYRAVGRLRLRIGDRAGALRAWNELARLFPDDTAVREELARMLVGAELFEEAIVHYRRLRELGGDDYGWARASQELAALLYRLHRYDEGDVVYTDLVETLAPGSWLRQEVFRRFETERRRRIEAEPPSTFYGALARSRPGDFELRGVLAQALFREGRVAEAIGIWRETLERGAGDEVRIALAEALVADGRTGEAATELTRVAEAAPGVADHWKRLGQVVLADVEREPDERRRDAELAWRRIASERPDDPSRMLEAAGLFRAHDMVDAALEYYERAVALDPATAAHHEYLGEYRHEIRDRDGAVAAWRDLVERAGATPENRVRLVTLLANNAYREEALAAADEALAALASGPGVFAVAAIQVRLYCDLDLMENARRALQTMSALAGSEGDRRETMQRRVDWARRFQRLGAEIARLEAREAATGSLDAFDYEYLARLHGAAGDGAASVRAIERARAAAPEDVALASFAVEIYRRHGAADRAVATLEELLGRHAEGRVAYLEEMVALRADAGDLAGAIAVARRVVEAAPERGRGAILLADLLDEAGDFDASLRTLESARSRSPGDAGLELALARRLRDADRLVAALGHFEGAFRTAHGAESRLAIAEEIAALAASVPGREGTATWLVDALLELEPDDPLRREQRRLVADRLIAIARELVPFYPDRALPLLERARRIADHHAAVVEATLLALEIHAHRLDAEGVLASFRWLTSDAIRRFGLRGQGYLEACYRLGEAIFVRRLWPSVDDPLAEPEWEPTALRAARALDEAGRTDELFRILDAADRHPHWVTTICDPLRLLLLIRAGRAAQEEIDRAVGEMLGRRPLDGSTEATWLDAAQDSFIHALAGRLRGAEPAQRLARYRLKQSKDENAKAALRIDLFGMLAQAAAGDDRPDEAGVHYRSLLGLTATEGSTTVASANAEYRLKARWIRRMLEQGFVELAVDALLELIDRATPSFASLPSPWRERVEVLAHALRDVDLTGPIRRTRERLAERPFDSTLMRTLVFYLGLRDDQDAIADLGQHALRELTPRSSRLVPLARSLRDLGHERVAQELVLRHELQPDSRGGRAAADGLDPRLFARWFESAAGLESLASAVRRSGAGSRRLVNWAGTTARIVERNLRRRAGPVDRELLLLVLDVYRQADFVFPPVRPEIQRPWLPDFVGLARFLGEGSEAYQRLLGAFFDPAETGVGRLTHRERFARPSLGRGRSGECLAVDLFELARENGDVDALRDHVDALLGETRSRLGAFYLRLVLAIGSGENDLAARGLVRLVDRVKGVAVDDRAARLAGAPDWWLGIDLESGSEEPPTSALLDQAYEEPALRAQVLALQWDLMNGFWVADGSIRSLPATATAVAQQLGRAGETDAARRLAALAGRGTAFVAGAAHVLADVGAPVDAVVTLCRALVGPTAAGVLSREGYEAASEFERLAGWLAALDDEAWSSVLDESRWTIVVDDVETPAPPPLGLRLARELLAGRAAGFRRWLDRLAPRDDATLMAVLVPMARRVADPEAAIGLILEAFGARPAAFEGTAAELLLAAAAVGSDLPLTDPRVAARLRRQVVSGDPPPELMTVLWEIATVAADAERDAAFLAASRLLAGAGWGDFAPRRLETLGRAGADEAWEEVQRLLGLASDSHPRRIATYELLYHDADDPESRPLLASIVQAAIASGHLDELIAASRRVLGARIPDSDVAALMRRETMVWVGLAATAAVDPVAFARANPRLEDSLLNYRGATEGAPEGERLREAFRRVLAPPAGPSTPSPSATDADRDREVGLSVGLVRVASGRDELVWQINRLGPAASREEERAVRVAFARAADAVPVEDYDVAIDVGSSRDALRPGRVAPARGEWTDAAGRSRLALAFESPTWVRLRLIRTGRTVAESAAVLVLPGSAAGVVDRGGPLVRSRVVDLEGPLLESAGAAWQARALGARIERWLDGGGFPWETLQVCAWIDPIAIVGRWSQLRVRYDGVGTSVSIGGLTGGGPVFLQVIASPERGAPSRFAGASWDVDPLYGPLVRPSATSGLEPSFHRRTPVVVLELGRGLCGGGVAWSRGVASEDLLEWGERGR